MIQIRFDPRILYPARKETFPLTRKKRELSGRPLEVFIATLLGIPVAWDASHYIFGFGHPLASFASSSAIGAKMYEFLLSPEFWGHWTRTMFAMLLGYTIGLIVGLVYGVWASGWYVGRGNYVGILLYVFGIPKTLLIPILMAWFGFRSVGPAVFVAALTTFLPVSMATFLGLIFTPPDQIEAAQNLGARTWRRYWTIGRPNAVSIILMGCLYGYNAALPTLIAAEMIGGSGGIGYFVHERYAVGDIAGAYALVPLIAIQNILIIAGLYWLIQRFRIKQNVRKEIPATA